MLILQFMFSLQLNMELTIVQLANIKINIIGVNYVYDL